MTNLKNTSCCALLFLSLDSQSLVDVAREEAVRRAQLEQQGIQGKVIIGNGLQSHPGSANITTTTGTDLESERAPARESAKRSEGSLREHQSALKKLDREIRQIETRIESLQARLKVERWEALKSGKLSSRSRTGKSRNQTEAAIDKLKEKLKDLRTERFEAYESGRKAGHLPGELDGKHLTP